MRLSCSPLIRASFFLEAVMDTDYVLAAHPFYALRDHVMIDFASPNGPNPPIDAQSVEVRKYFA